ncbi:MAG: CinA family protein [Anaerolineae bacterium]|nr:CinA family protein [Anaerolineae bacterium]
MQDRATALAAEIGTLLKQRGWTLATAESCTGGLVSHAITNISGSSTYFMGGVVAYDNKVKRRLLEVPEEWLRQYGAVSRQVALAMARGVRRLLGTDVGISVTGIAGPTGGTPEKPVGTVFIAVVSPLGEEVEHHLWEEDRLGNKRLSAEAVLTLLKRHLEG